MELANLMTLIILFPFYTELHLSLVLFSSLLLSSVLFALFVGLEREMSLLLAFWLRID